MELASSHIHLYKASIAYGNYLQLFTTLSIDAKSIVQCIVVSSPYNNKRQDDFADSKRVYLEKSLAEGFFGKNSNAAIAFHQCKRERAYASHQLAVY